MRNYHLRRSSVYCKAINVDQLFTLIPEETRLKYANQKNKAVVIDVVKKVRSIFSARVPSKILHCPPLSSLNEVNLKLLKCLGQ